MRNASFQHTQEQMRVGAAAARASANGYAGFVDGGKDVTRRLRWPWAKPGMYLCAVNKGMGLRPGEQQVVFGVIEILTVERETLIDIERRAGWWRDVAREGFPRLSPSEFVAMFCEHMDCSAHAQVARVVFRHVDWRRILPAWHALTLSQQEKLAP